MKRSKTLLNMLEPVLESARAVLRDLEPDEVPPGVRKVAKFTERRLPAPFAQSLLAELDQNDWLREKVAESGLDADPDSDDVRSVAADLFLHRPDEWDQRLQSLAEEDAAARAGSGVASMEQALERMKVALDLAKEKERKARLAMDDVRSEADKKVKEARTAAEAARRAASAPSAELYEALNEERLRAERLRAELIEAGGRIDSLKHMLLKERRVERGSGDERGPQVWGPGDPLESSRMLDDMMVALRPRTGGPAPDASDAGTLGIPEGIRPDDVDAILWILKQERPLTVVVDGYNVSAQLDRSQFPTPELRNRVKDGLMRLRRLATGLLPVILVFDSAEEAATIPGFVEVRFALSADDEVVRLSAELPDDVIVISNDREVRERAEQNGAIALWSDALIGWMGKSR